jgi:two-component system, chemotaxis family, protein-glutamate methylesterase/glutaminase
MSSEKTKLTCPDCAGAVERIQEGDLVQYRCRIGHLYSPQSALETHDNREENTLWSSVVLLEEGAELAEDIAHLKSSQSPNHLLESAKAKRALANRLREIAREFPATIPTYGNG